MCGRLNAVVILFLFLFSLPLASSANLSDFVKVSIGGKEAYTQKTLVGSQYIVASDKVVYASNSGLVSMKLYLGDKLASGDYKVGLRTVSKNITVKSVDVGKSKNSVLSVASKDYVYPNTIHLDGNATEVTVTVQFDPSDVGVSEEFDVILYNDKDDVLATYDPFLSGFSYYQDLTLDTTQLSADVTNDHTIIVYIPPTNTNFWTNHPWTTYNGIDFTQSDGTSILDFNTIKYSNADNNAWFAVEVTPTFTSAANLQIRMYYGGPNTDYTDGVGAYTADLNVMNHFNETGGVTVGNSAPDGINTTISSDAGWNGLGLVDGAYTFDGTIAGTATIGAATDFTILANINLNLAALQGDIVDLGTTGIQGTRLYYRTSGACTNSINFDTTESGGGALCSDPIAENVWYNVAARYSNSDTNKTLYINGVDVNTIIQAGGTGTTFFLSRYWDADSSKFDGRIDEIRYYARALSPDEIKLLYLSDMLQLVTFGAQQETGAMADFNYGLSKLDTNSFKLTLIDASTVPSDGSISISSWSYYLNSTVFYTSTTSGNTTKNLPQGDYNVTLIIDLNTGGNAQKDKQINTFFPTITVSDYNVNAGFSITEPTQFGGLTMKCIDAIDVNLTYTIQVNDYNYYNASGDANRTVNINDVNFLDGENNVVFTCVDLVNASDTNSITFSVYKKNFYFVQDKNGTLLTSVNDYVLADVNSVYAYSFNTTTPYDMYTAGVVGIYYVGDSNDGVEFKINYTDPTFPSVSKYFDLSVLDTNSVPMCFSPLQSFYQQLMYSSVERGLRFKNAFNGCYHVAANTRYAYQDFFSVSAYTIPQSYYLYVDTDGNVLTPFNLLAIVDGTSAGSINLDALIIKESTAREIVISGERATISKQCVDGVDDCNTFVVYYLNSALNNDHVDVTIYNGSAAQLAYTETDSPNDFTLSFDSTALDFDANVLRAVVLATRYDGTTKSFTVYFTPQGQVGYIDPNIALILSFIIFIGGITLVSSRIIFGWFGAMIALMAIAFLSFSVGAWYVTFMQAIMFSMLVYIGITFSQSQSGAI